MPTLTIDDQTVTVEPGTLLIDACRAAGVTVPHFCYHPCLKVAATCRMCAVEVKGQPKLVTSCSTAAAEGMEVRTDSVAVADARAAVIEFLLANHPLDCPICDQAGECKLQDFSYRYGSGDSRMSEPKARYGYEELGAKVVIDKNRCIHCTRCVRFARDITGTGELTATSRGAHLEITTFEGRTLDDNPFAGNLVDLCPVGALTSRDFRFKKRTWYLKPIPTISRHGADAKEIFADVAQNKVWRFRTRSGASPICFISDRERVSWERYNLDPARRPTAPTLRGQLAEARMVAIELMANGPIAVVAQGAFGTGAVQCLGSLATAVPLRYAHGNIRIPIENPAIQQSDDGIINRSGLLSQGYRFDALQELDAKIASKEVKAVVVYHDAAFSDEHENALLKRIVEKAPFSLLLEPIPSDLARIASATLPVTTYLEESDSVTDHHGLEKKYSKALEPPSGIKSPRAWVDELVELAASPVG